MQGEGKTIKQRFGDWGERVAIRFLTQKGYTICTRNAQFRGGEIDIIAWHKKVHFGNTLCFIEVKTRASRHETGLWAAAHPKKMAAMQHAAKQYCLLQDINIDDTPIQFEYVAVTPVPNRGTAAISHKIITL